MSEARFHWTCPGMVPARDAYYPPEEGDRTQPWAAGIWSQVETLPLERLRAIQLARLQRLVTFAWERSPFYRRLWEQHGVSPAAIKTLDDVKSCPWCARRTSRPRSRRSRCSATSPLLRRSHPRS